MTDPIETIVEDAAAVKSEGAAAIPQELLSLPGVVRQMQTDLQTALAAASAADDKATANADTFARALADLADLVQVVEKIKTLIQKDMGVSL